MRERISIGKLVLFILFYVIMAISILQVRWYQPTEIPRTSTALLGKVIFNLQGFVIPFEILSLVLLAAMIGAVYIAKEEVK
jgi:NADH:ubiquinone oxidoreductase subunit 6 (subunit J)